MDNKYLTQPLRVDGMLKIMDRLLKNKGIDEYVVFDWTEEGSEAMPGGALYPCSGWLLTKAGQIFSFWFEWDDSKQDYTVGESFKLTDGSTFNPWYEETDPSIFDDNQNLLVAKKTLGLA